MEKLGKSYVKKPFKCPSCKRLRTCNSTKKPIGKKATPKSVSRKTTSRKSTSRKTASRKSRSRKTTSKKTTSTRKSKQTNRKKRADSVCEDSWVERYNALLAKGPLIKKDKRNNFMNKFIPDQCQKLYRRKSSNTIPNDENAVSVPPADKYIKTSSRPTSHVFSLIVHVSKLLLRILFWFIILIFLIPNNVLFLTATLIFVFWLLFNLESESVRCFRRTIWNLMPDFFDLFSKISLGSSDDGSHGSKRIPQSNSKSKQTLKSSSLPTKHTKISSGQLHDEDMDDQEKRRSSSSKTKESSKSKQGKSDSSESDSNKDLGVPLSRHTSFFKIDPIQQQDPPNDNDDDDSENDEVPFEEDNDSPEIEIRRTFTDEDEEQYPMEGYPSRRYNLSARPLPPPRPMFLRSHIHLSDIQPRNFRQVDDAPSCHVGSKSLHSRLISQHSFHDNSIRGTPVQQLEYSHRSVHNSNISHPNNSYKGDHNPLAHNDPQLFSTGHSNPTSWGKGSAKTRSRERANYRPRAPQNTEYSNTDSRHLDDPYSSDPTANDIAPDLLNSQQTNLLSDPATDLATDIATDLATNPKNNLGLDLESDLSSYREKGIPTNNTTRKHESSKLMPTIRNHDSPESYRSHDSRINSKTDRSTNKLPIIEHHDSLSESYRSRTNSRSHYSTNKAPTSKTYSNFPYGGRSLHSNDRSKQDQLSGKNPSSRSYFLDNTGFSPKTQENNYPSTNQPHDTTGHQKGKDHSSNRIPSSKSEFIENTTKMINDHIQNEQSKIPSSRTSNKFSNKDKPNTDADRSQMDQRANNFPLSRALNDFSRHPSSNIANQKSRSRNGQPSSETNNYLPNNRTEDDMSNIDDPTMKGYSKSLIRDSSRRITDKVPSISERSSKAPSFSRTGRRQAMNKSKSSNKSTERSSKKRKNFPEYSEQQMNPPIDNHNQALKPADHFRESSPGDNQFDNTQPPNNRRENPYDNNRPQSNRRENPYDNNRPQSNKRENQFANDRPQSNKRENQFTNDRPQSNRPENIFDNDRPQSNRLENLIDNDRPQTHSRGNAIDNNRPQSNRRENPLDNARPQSNSRGNPYDNNRPQSNIRENPFDNDRPQSNRRENPFDNNRPQSNSRGNPYDNNRPQSNNRGPNRPNSRTGQSPSSFPKNLTRSHSDNDRNYGSKNMKPSSRSASAFPIHHPRRGTEGQKPKARSKSAFINSQTDQENALPSTAQDISSDFSNNPLNEQNPSRTPMRNPRYPNRPFVPPLRSAMPRTETMSSEDNSSTFNRNIIRPHYIPHRGLGKRMGGPGRVRMLHNHPNQMLNTRNLGVLSPRTARAQIPGEYQMRAYYPPPRMGQPRMTSTSPQTKKRRVDMRGNTGRPPRPIPRV
ncbi:hypothetical protein SNEBB_006040 [Seison nebaliae]|nr:hypothetical protein SNEBB_006040 [Seison nebaliae]